MTKMTNSRRNSSNWVIWVIGIAFIIWVFVFIRVNPMPELFSWKSCNQRADKRSDVNRPMLEEGSISVPIQLIMSGEPIALEQDDEDVINYIWREHHLEPPSQESYNLDTPWNVDPSLGQGQFIRRILRNMTGGFFVECGAIDGETRSNTLFLEKYLNWTGLLVEGDPANYEITKTKQRKTWLSNTCLSIKPYPHQTDFPVSVSRRKVIEMGNPEKLKKVKVQCVPLFTLLTALNVTTVDYFSLDVAGSELKVLKTIPFHKVFIKTLSVECTHLSEGKSELISFMKSKGFKNVGEVSYPGGYVNDVMFTHESVKINS